MFRRIYGSVWSFSLAREVRRKREMETNFGVSLATKKHHDSLHQQPSHPLVPLFRETDERSEQLEGFRKSPRKVSPRLHRRRIISTSVRPFRILSAAEERTAEERERGDARGEDLPNYPNRPSVFPALARRNALDNSP